MKKNLLKYFIILLLTSVTVATARTVPGLKADLDSYKWDGIVYRLKGIKENLSGITYNWDTDTYFTVENNGGIIHEYTSDLKTKLREIYLWGHNRDYEGITFLGRRRFAVVNERKNSVHTES